MNDKSYARVMAAKTHELAIDVHWVSMWHHVEEGNFESAMTSQLLWLVNRDEWIDVTDNMSTRDWQTLTKMHQIMRGRGW
jgi:hypothetical protein